MNTYKNSNRKIMTLSFSQKFPDKSPTLFVEKILSGSKIHTIRKDEKDRWKVGTNIHFVINNRTKNRFQFAPILPVKSIQKFRVSWDDGIVHIYIDDILFYTNIGLHSRFIEFHKQMQKFAENDGFSDIKSFLSWFNDDFDGKIIHWTDSYY